MSFLRSIFGPSKDEIWAAVAKDMGGRYIDGGFWGKDQLRYRSGEWILLLDTFSAAGSNLLSNNSSIGNRNRQTYTRLRVPFINKDGLYFKIYHSGIFSEVGKWFGMQDIEVGYPAFDDHFVIKGNDDDKVRRLFSMPTVQELLGTQPRVMIMVKDDEGLFAQDYPQGVDLLYFHCAGTLRDAEQIKLLFELFCEILQGMVQLDSAYEDDPRIRL